MADLLRLRLEHLQELSKQVNAAADEAGRIVQGVESYLGEVIHLGVCGSVLIDSDEDSDNGFREEYRLAYGRYGDKFRIYVIHSRLIDGSYDVYEETLWANCPRDIKLLAYNNLIPLLDELGKSLRNTLDQVKANNETLEALLPPPKTKAKEKKA